MVTTRGAEVIRIGHGNRGHRPYRRRATAIEGGYVY